MGWELECWANWLRKISPGLRDKSLVKACRIQRQDEILQCCCLCSAPWIHLATFPKSWGKLGCKEAATREWQVWAETPFAFAFSLHSASSLCFAFLLPFSPLCLLARLQSAHRPGYPSKWYCEMQSTLFSVRVFDWELSAVRVRVGLAAPSQRRDGGVVESSRNWPDRYCRPAKIITCWNGNPVSLQGRDGPRNGCKRSPSRDLDQILRNISTFQDGFRSSMVFDR